MQITRTIQKQQQKHELATKAEEEETGKKTVVFLFKLVKLSGGQGAVGGLLTVTTTTTMTTITTITNDRQTTMTASNTNTKTKHDFDQFFFLVFCLNSQIPLYISSTQFVFAIFVVLCIDVISIVVGFVTLKEQQQINFIII